MRLPARGGLHSAEQAAVALDVPAATVRRWIRQGLAAHDDVLPSRGRAGQLKLYRLAELEPLADAYHARRTTRAGGDDS